jgi:hypothetical protein
MQTDLSSIIIMNIRIDEPLTTLTDILVAAACFYGFFRLNSISGKQNLHILLRYFFLFLGTGTFLGGLIGHGLLYLLSPGWRLPGWLISMVSIAIIQQASILIAGEFSSRFFIRFLTWMNFLVLTVFLILTSVTQDFLITVLYMAFSLLIVVGGIHLRYFVKSGSAGSAWFLAAVGTGLASGLIYVSGCNLFGLFNSMDLGHLLLIFAVYFFYLGGRYFILKPGAAKTNDT